ncbi:MAG TPA: hypothetical protein VHH53_10660, partial [Pseudonocardiaceae bacterium]|nr:hypothetical protein [Pseudonocardiaceae bacterium]
RVDSELAQERARLLEAQRIARIGSFTWEWGTSNKLSYSPALAELFAGRRAGSSGRTRLAAGSRQGGPANPVAGVTRTGL